MKGVGFRELVAKILEIGSLHGKLDVDSLLPEPRTISRNISVMATEMRNKLMEKIKLVRQLFLNKIQKN